jgi:hypothetical protein
VDEFCDFVGADDEGTGVVHGQVVVPVDEFEHAACVFDFAVPREEIR